MIEPEKILDKWLQQEYEISGIQVPDKAQHAIKQAMKEFLYENVTNTEIYEILPQDSILRCSCKHPEKIVTVHPLPDICNYCRKITD